MFSILTVNSQTGVWLDDSTMHEQVKPNVFNETKFSGIPVLHVRKSCYQPLILYGIPSLLYASGELVRHLHDLKITGFECHDVKIVRHFKHEEDPEEYFLLEVIGWGGIAREDAGVKRLPESDFGRFKYSKFDADKVSFVVDRNTWDGSDIFRVWPFPQYTWVTGRFADAIREFGSLNAKTVNEGVFPKYVQDEKGSPFQPSPLNEYYSKELAEKYGKVLGIDDFEYQHYSTARK